MSALVAIVAAGLLYLLMLGTPQPNTFFTWIMGLATLAAVVYPFSTSAPLDQKVATAIVNLVLGIAIISLLTMVAARSLRRSVPPPSVYGDGAGYGPGQGYGPEPGYRPGQPGPGPGQGQRPNQGGYAPDPRGNQPTLPIDEPPGNGSRRDQSPGVASTSTTPGGTSVSPEKTRSANSAVRRAPRTPPRS